VVLTRAPENVGENHDIRFEAHSHSDSLVQEAGVQGVQAHPQNFWFGENPGKITWNPGKICGNLGKMPEYLRKIAVYALILQKSADLCFYWRSMPWRPCTNLCFFSSWIL